MLKIVVAALLALAVYRSGRVFYHHILTVPALPPAYYAGGNWSTHCTRLDHPALSACEDIAFWDLSPTDRRVLLSCDPNRHAWNTVMGPLRDPGPRGALWVHTPATGTVERLVLADYPATHDLHPLGLAVWPDPPTLFVVNHARAETTVEQLALDPARPAVARHRRTLRSPHFVSPNALVATGPASFWVSNDHWMTRRLPGVLGRVLPVLESLAALPLGWVAHVDVEDGLVHTVVARGIPFANGLALSPDGAWLAVAATSLGAVQLYAVDGTALRFSHEVPTPFLPDNVAWDDRELVVAGHPHFPSLVDVAANKSGARAPSWAVALTNTSLGHADARAPLPASRLVPTSAMEIETLFQSDGSVFGTSSTALRDARTGTLYVAGLYEHGLLACRP